MSTQGCAPRSHSPWGVGPKMLTHSPQRGGGQGFGQQCTALLWAVHHLLGCRACSAGFKHCTGSMLCITIMGPIAGLHSPCTKKHTPIHLYTYTRTREKFCYENCFGILSKIFSQGGTLTTKFSLKKHEKMRENSDIFMKMGNILSKTWISLIDILAIFWLYFGYFQVNLR